MVAAIVPVPPLTQQPPVIFATPQFGIHVNSAVSVESDGLWYTTPSATVTSRGWFVQAARGAAAELRDRRERREQIGGRDGWDPTVA